MSAQSIRGGAIPSGSRDSTSCWESLHLPSFSRPEDLRFHHGNWDRSRTDWASGCWLSHQAQEYENHPFLTGIQSQTIAIQQDSARQAGSQAILCAACRMLSFWTSIIVCGLFNCAWFCSTWTTNVQFDVYQFWWASACFGAVTWDQCSAQQSGFKQDSLCDVLMQQIPNQIHGIRWPWSMCKTENLKSQHHKIRQTITY